MLRSMKHNPILPLMAMFVPLTCGALILHADEVVTPERSTATPPAAESADVQEQQRDESDQPDESADSDQSAPPSLDDLLGLEQEEQDRGAEEAARRGHEEELERRLSEERIADAFAEAIAKMSLSAEMLDERFDAGLGTQRVQEEIIAKLTQLIDEAQQQQASGSSSSSSASGSPQQQQDPGQQGGRQDQQASSSDQDGTGDQETGLPPGQQPDVNVMLEESREEWGALPDRIRDMLLQGRQERFSGLYEQLTREYYRRLAED